MSQSNLPQSLLNGTAPKKIRMLIARGLAPIPPGEMLELLVCLLEDKDTEVATQAAQTIQSWEAKEIQAQLQSADCPPSVLQHYATTSSSEELLQIIIANPKTPDLLVQTLALTAPTQLLESILDNRVRILKFPGILESIKHNVSASPAILRQVQEIEVEFLGEKKKEYAVDAAADIEQAQQPLPEMEFEVPPEDLTLEGLPLDAKARESEMVKKLASLPVPQKIRYALFGNREIRSMLVRDTNKEVARTVLRSPKLTDNEVESIAAMRNVAEDILREIGNSKGWTKSYAVVQNLVKNPKTPAVISQRLLFRLRAQDLMMLSRDRSVSDAVRYSASRAFRQRSSANQSK
jgi:hypothetical protein